MPFLSMVRNACAETFSLIQRFSLATQKRRSCRFGRKRRRVLLLACETLLPVCTRLPETWHTRDITHLEKIVCLPWPGGRRPHRRHPWGSRRCTIAGVNGAAGGGSESCFRARPVNGLSMGASRPDAASRALCRAAAAHASPVQRAASRRE